MGKVAVRSDGPPIYDRGMKESRLAVIARRAEDLGMANYMAPERDPELEQTARRRASEATSLAFQGHRPFWRGRW